MSSKGEEDGRTYQRRLTYGLIVVVVLLVVVPAVLGWTLFG